MLLFRVEGVHCCTAPHFTLWRGVSYVGNVRISEGASKANTFLSSFSWDPAAHSEHMFCTAPLLGGDRITGAGCSCSIHH